ncbi:aspartyl/asparaginyl beta-hydroxylase domain-containing protein [Sphingomonas sp. CA1-15]|uniref:Aspartyl/asparaginyl beta-hydroxylase domain-containing protein n=2 Tax=Sphingomonas immobilis TaxID=3063997 RepID=A0ABT8ZZZ2_9SPHN|nr:aspartyl/asparaginyl beta-hydroxylase domain-containing protein [Sphingomonas sp. CA1-15]
MRGQEWTPHLVTQNFEGDWSVVALRHTAGATHPVMKIYSDPNATAFEDDPLLDRAPAFRALLAALQCPLQAVRLMRLTPGSIIKEHRDHDLSVEFGSARLHVPIVTNAGVDFRLSGTPVPLREGEIWYLRLADPHSVANRGDTDRVHLVIDCTVNDWLLDMLGG